MGEKVVIKPESLLNLDDLLQCPVCYEIPTGQIFQCNEGHHVCGRCKVRLDVCPVCRALFFGTRNYAMEELIANFRKVRALKTGGKSSAESGSSDSSTTAKEVVSVEPEIEAADEENNETNSTDEPLRAPPACKGLFRCLCCKIGKAERLPSARLLNHLRYFHAPDLIEGRSENGEYLQAWHFSTTPGRLVTAVRVAEMGVFFLIIEITSNTIHAWMTMASSPWVAQSYNYTITLSGADREAIFTDTVWSVRSCEGTLKKRGHTLVVTGTDAQVLVSATALSGKLSVRRTPFDQLVHQAPPRVIMRVANRGSENAGEGATNNTTRTTTTTTTTTTTPTRLNDFDVLEPFLQDLQNDVERISRAFASLDREAGVRAFVQANNEDGPVDPVEIDFVDMLMYPDRPATGDAPMSRNARRRMRQRLRAALNDTLLVREDMNRLSTSGPVAQSNTIEVADIRPQPNDPESNHQLENGQNTGNRPDSTNQSGQNGRGGSTRITRRKRRHRR